MLWFFQKFRENKREKARQKAVYHEFIAMSHSAKTILSYKDRLTKTGLHLDCQLFTHENPKTRRYCVDIIKSLATSDYSKMKNGFSTVADFSPEKLMDLFILNEERLEKLASLCSIELGEISEEEWDMIAQKYFRYMADLQRKDYNLQCNLLRAKSTHGASLRRLIHIEEALDELASLGNGEQNTKNENEWTKTFQQLS